MSISELFTSPACGRGRLSAAKAGEGRGDTSLTWRVPRRPLPQAGEVKSLL
jgi:hypothetical protein